jgi:hypothetical protein
MQVLKAIASRSIKLMRLHLWNVPEPELVMACRQSRWNLRRSRRVRFQSYTMIYRVAEALFAPQVSLRCLYRDLPQWELNLLQADEKHGIITQPPMQRTRRCSHFYRASELWRPNSQMKSGRRSVFRSRHMGSNLHCWMSASAIWQQLRTWQCVSAPHRNNT